MKTGGADLLVVIVNYRTAGMVAECLAALYRAPPEHEVRVVVVDNASGDDSAGKLRDVAAAAPAGLPVCVVEAARNGGFAYGNNLGVREGWARWGRARHILFLNPDTLARPGALDALVSFLEAHARCGIAGAALVDASDRPQRAAHEMITPLRELARGSGLGVFWRLLGMVEPEINGELKCEWVSGAALCVRAEVFEQLGGMDEGFFLYFEEVDLCRRALCAGWEVWFVPSAVVVHLEGGATGIGDRARRRPRYWFESRRRFFAKHYGLIGLVVADCLWAAGRCARTLRRMLRTGRPAGSDPPQFARDLLGGDIRAILSGRAGAEVHGGAS